MCFFKDVNLIELGTALLTPLIAFIAAGIAYQQMRTNKNQLKLSMYDRRFNIYQSVNELLAKILVDGRITLKELIDFNYETRQSAFLLDKSGADYMELLYKKGRELAGANLMLYGPEKLDEGKKREAAAIAEKECLDWFKAQYGVVHKMFIKYLRLDNLGS